MVVGPNKPICRMCGYAEGGRRFTLREMQFGWREPFEYVECGACASIQIVEAPGDLGRYYGSGYYSFTNHARAEYPLIKRLLKRARGRYAIEGRGLLGRLLSRTQGHWWYFDWFREAGVHLNARILDVGCGRGDFLFRFASDGFSSLTGIDPFVESDLHFNNGIHIYKKSVHEMDGEFDCVFCNHAFEHMPDPAPSMARLYDLVAHGGVVMIALPVAECWAWKTYGVHWHALDPPRHLVIPSPRAMVRLAEQAGFKLEKIHWNSSEAQMTISRANQQDVPFVEYQKRGGATAFFTDSELSEFRAKAQALNAAGQGDMACFILRKGSRHHEN